MALGYAFKNIQLVAIHVVILLQPRLLFLGKIHYIISGIELYFMEILAAFYEVDV